jgi:2-oxoglutarate dehydrogenase E2 component (dihydrolipoamide succinyltransferase)
LAIKSFFRKSAMSINTRHIEIESPVYPESVTEATVIKWYVQEGDFVELDQRLVDLETDKVILEVLATAPGQVMSILAPEGAIVPSKAVLGELAEVAFEGAAAPLPKEKTTAAVLPPEPLMETPKGLARLFSGPSARRAAKAKKGAEGVMEPKASTSLASAQDKSLSKNPVERVPMTRLRAKIAERLLAAQHQAAILTTFNEVNLQPIMDVRGRHKDTFEKKYNIRLGFMSFFTKAAVEALKQFPGVNASIEGNDIIYHRYYDIGIAVSTDRGLVVPVLRNADQLSFSAIEKTIHEYGQKARNGTISLDELSGGTFTITNGGVFGSLLSTPILNPPQSGILGMHKIEERPVVENGQIVIRPMMYLALSYDHRIIDGKESVQFLATIKNLLEDPARFLLDI